jgi:hypothetical protein
LVIVKFVIAKIEMLTCGTHEELLQNEKLLMGS